MVDYSLLIRETKKLKCMLLGISGQQLVEFWSISISNSPLSLICSSSSSNSSAPPHPCPGSAVSANPRTQQLGPRSSHAREPAPSLVLETLQHYKSIVRLFKASLSSAPLLHEDTSLLVVVVVKLSRSLWGKSCTSRPASAVTRSVPR